MFKFKKIIINSIPEKACSAGLLELNGKDDRKALQKYISNGFIGAKALPYEVIKEIINLAIKYNKLMFDGFKKPKNKETRAFEGFYTALRIFEIIYSSNGNFWVIEAENGEIAGFFYIYDVISLIHPVKNPPKNEIEYIKKPHTAVLAGCLKKNFWGLKSKKILYEILSMLFEKENLKKIKCEIFASNPYVKGILKRFDFICEGVLKGETINRGKPENVEIWALFEEKWRAKFKKESEKTPESQ